MTIASKGVKRDSKIIISLRQSKYVTHSEEFGKKSGKILLDTFHSVIVFCWFDADDNRISQIMSPHD